MTWVIIIVLFLALALLLTPFWGWIGAIVYGSIAWLGQLFAGFELSDGTVAFRAGVLLGGTISTLCLLRVAWKDRSRSYLLAGSMVAMGMAVLLFATGLPPSWATQANASTATGGRSDVPSKPSLRNRWTSRSGYERDVSDRVDEIARFAARGDLERADALLDELELWSRGRPRFGGNAALQDQLIDEYAATFDENPEAESSPGRLQVERLELLRKIWDLSPSNSTVGMRLMMTDMAILSFEIWRSGGTRDAEVEGQLEQRLRELHIFQRALFGYEPMEAELWKSYAATTVDNDEELALGAFVVAEQLRRSGKGVVALSGQRMLLESDLRVSTGLLTSKSKPRVEIIRARAGRLVSEQASKATSMQPASPPAGSEEGSAGEAPSPEQAMPPAGWLTADEGLALSPAPAPPASFAGEMRADLAAAGFNAVHGGIITQGALPEDRQLPVVQLVLDVWEDGRITSVLVERSSGHEMFDRLARVNAQRLENTAKVPAGGERRRVSVHINPPESRTPTGPRN